MRALAIVLLVVGIALLAIGIIYYAVPVDKLPSIMGHIAKGTGHRTKRGLAGVVSGAVALVAAAVAFRRSHA